MDQTGVVLLFLTMLLLGGVVVLWIAMANRRALHEMQHRERLAMIQKGLIPAPEADPLGFEAATFGEDEPRSPRAERWRTAGMLTIGFGLATMVLMTFAADAPMAALGIGGAFAILGGALLINGAQMSKDDDRRARIAASKQIRPAVPREPGAM